MELQEILILVGFLVFFVGMVYFAISSQRKENQTKRDNAQSFGFSPIQPEASLLEEIGRLYRRPNTKVNYILQNVSRKVIMDGEMYLLDLVDTYGDNTTLERQAVVVTSPRLNLPFFQLIPKPNSQYALSGLANKALEWMMVGEKIDFSDSPDFNARYLVASSEDESKIRAYLDETALQILSRTEMYGLHAGGRLFVFSEFFQKSDVTDPQTLSQRISRAHEVFRLLQR